MFDRVRMLSVAMMLTELPLHHPVTCAQQGGGAGSYEFLRHSLEARHGCGSPDLDILDGSGEPRTSLYYIISHNSSGISRP